jgi:hypothetical protein
MYLEHSCKAQTSQSGSTLDGIALVFEWRE